MTSINLLNDITRTGKTKKPKNHRSRWFSLWGKPHDRAEREPKKGLLGAAVVADPAKSPSRLRAALLFLLPVISCVALENMLQDWVTEAIERLSAKLSAEEEKLQGALQQIPSLAVWQKKHQNIAKAARLSKELEPIDLDLSREFLIQMKESLPPEVWVKHFAIVQKKDIKSITIEGYAFTSEVVLLFLSQLKEKPLYRSVLLNFSEPTEENGILEHRFQIVGTLETVTAGR